MKIFSYIRLRPRKIKPEADLTPKKSDEKATTKVVAEEVAPKTELKPAQYRIPMKDDKVSSQEN